MKIDLTKYKPFKGLLSIEEYSILTIIDNYCEISENGYYHQPASYITNIIGDTDQSNLRRIKQLIDSGYLIARSKKGYKTRKMLKPSSKYFKTKENEST